MRLAGNLNASAPAFQGDVTNALDRQNPLNQTSWTESTIGVFDSQGTRHDVKVLMYKLDTPANSWGWQLDPAASAQRVATTASAPAGSTVPSPIALPAAPTGFALDPANVVVYSAAGTPFRTPDDYTVAGGQIQFTSGGSIAPGTQIEYGYFMGPDPAAPGVNGGTFTFDATGLMIPTGTAPTLSFAVPGANPVSVALDLGGGVNGLTQFANASTAVLRDQDGFTAGQLQNFSIDRSGLITGFFTNGTTTPLGRIVLASFNNPAGLLRAGDNMYQESANSGGAVLGFALEGSAPSITSGALEMSNVDLAQEFTNMIVAQRGFQANGKVISTSDEMLQDLMQIKR
jgi:flagellar hook protein FlgE